MLKAYLSAQPSSLSAFVIWKTHTVAQKPRGRQLNAKVCGSESAALPDCCPLHRTPFSNLVRMCTRCLVPRPKTTVIGLVHTGKHGWHGLFRGSGRAHGHHVGKVLHSVAYL